jgi:hypothetical protein
MILLSPESLSKNLREVPLSAGPFLALFQAHEGFLLAQLFAMELQDAQRPCNRHERRCYGKIQ